MQAASWNWVTWAFIALAWVGFIAWDVFLATRGAATESMLIRDLGKAATVWPHLWGFLLGHWFVPRQSKLDFGWMVGLAIWGVLLAWDILWAAYGRPQTWYRYEGAWLVIGIISGAILWNQIDPLSPIP